MAAYKKPADRSIFHAKKTGNIPDCPSRSSYYLELKTSPRSGSRKVNLRSKLLFIHRAHQEDTHQQCYDIEHDGQV